MKVEINEFKRDNFNYKDYLVVLFVVSMSITVFYLKESSIYSVYKGIFFSLFLMFLVLFAYCSKNPKVIRIEEEGIKYFNSFLKWEEIEIVLFTVDLLDYKNVIEIATNRKVYRIRPLIYKNGKELRDLIEEYCKSKLVKYAVRDAACKW